MKGELLAEKGKERRRVGEVAGGTAAECAAICCCCPCSLMNLLILALYKLPAGLCRKACNNRKRRRLVKIKKNKACLLQQTQTNVHNPLCVSGFGPTHMDLVAEMKKTDDHDHDHDGGTEAVDLEKEMRDRFFAGGFWRSSSRRDTSS
uniref:Uncharacterized protein n=1 Tax=Fagus sylvatica TaxID=28930 RepID=A0A2N9H541_FAGSY